jgi:hypothetical protein
LATVLITGKGAKSYPKSGKDKLIDIPVNNPFDKLFQKGFLLYTNIK